MKRWFTIEILHLLTCSCQWCRGRRNHSCILLVLWVIDICKYQHYMSQSNRVSQSTGTVHMFRLVWGSSVQCNCTLTSEKLSTPSVKFLQSLVHHIKNKQIHLKCNASHFMIAKTISINSSSRNTLNRSIFNYYI